MRPIDGDRLLETVESMIDISIEGEENAAVVGLLLQCILNAIRDAPEAVPWVKCEDRQPPYPGLYIVTCYGYDMTGRKPVGITTSCSNWHHGKWLMEGVLAWAPLPEPYREEY